VRINGIIVSNINGSALAALKISEKKAAVATTISRQWRKSESENQRAASKAK